MSQQKVWFITGSSRGFGRVWTEAVLKRGDKVAASARNPKPLEPFVETYGEAWSSALCFDKAKMWRIIIFITSITTAQFARKRLTPDETRERIMVKADELFRQFGFEKTTVADIAEELGMSQANIDKFFSSKEAIIQASADRNLVVLREAVHRYMVEPGSALDRIEKVLVTVYRHTVDILRNERQVFKLMIRAYEQKWDCCAAFDNFLLQSFAKLVKEGMRTGEFKSADALATAHLLFDCLILIRTPHLYQQEVRELNEKRIRGMVRFLGRALK
jgi:AcrR family transcriptional regulator